ncbi:phosphatidylinositol-4-phosphate-5-kinase (Pi-PIPK-D2) [Achlya hypogyna]|uniref:Phosphatidylinositol-4-phosphate-5-kinase (Pi-PIPK-D2) n=1 Tax=Achlya hypogyna TaxID=1202772 RepID=A0A1V9YM85_ACHHY|nr:phosphatidylinositol-4-phosphate-5-kinase (Pi-PIPK-D2) [Achlya hypogyna]
MEPDAPPATLRGPVESTTSTLRSNSGVASSRGSKSRYSTHSSGRRMSFFGRTGEVDVLHDAGVCQSFELTVMEEESSHGNITSLRSVLAEGFSLRGITRSGLAVVLYGFIVIVATVAIAFSVTEFDGHEINPGLVMGAAQTFLTNSIVIVTFHGVHSFQRHPNPLLYYRAVMDLLLSLRFLLDPLWIHWGFYDPNEPKSCRYLSSATEFLFIAADAWFFMLALDLMLSLNNPFGSVKHNRRRYIIGVYSFAVVLSVLMASFGSNRLYGFAEGKFCWTRAKRYEKPYNPQSNSFFQFNVSTWLSFFVWMVIFYLFAFYVLLSGLKRLRHGISKTMETRKGMLRDGALSIISWAVYWTITFSLYAISFNANAKPQELRHSPLFKLYCYIVAGRGIVTYFLWFMINPAEKVIPYWLQFSQASIDINVSAQLNTSLQQDLLEYTVKGMTRAIEEADLEHKLPTRRTTVGTQGSVDDPSTDLRLTIHNNTAPPNADLSPMLKAKRQTKLSHVKFTSYRPSTFAALRGHFNVTTEDFVKSFEEATKPSISEGASGAFLFFSKDMRFIVKSMVKAEARFLIKIAPEYVEYLKTEESSVLTRFYGCFRITLYGNDFYFVVMENLFAASGQEIHHRYDIKGSWVNRSYQNPREGTKVKCRYCSMQFYYTSTVSKQQLCPNMAGPHEPNVVLKDDDLRTRLRIGDVAGQSLFRQLQADSQFLCSLGIMDYSLLIGVVDVEYKVDVAAASSANGANANSSLRVCDTITGPGYYCLGIIDILQTWNFDKKLERFMKIWFKRSDPDGISAIEPETYQKRFEQKCRQIIMFADVDPEASDVVASHHPRDGQNAYQIMALFASNQALKPIPMMGSSPMLFKTRSESRQVDVAMTPRHDPDAEPVWL